MRELKESEIAQVSGGYRTAANLLAGVLLGKFLDQSINYVMRDIQRQWNQPHRETKSPLRGTAL